MGGGAGGGVTQTVTVAATGNKLPKIGNPIVKPLHSLGVDGVDVISNVDITAEHGKALLLMAGVPKLKAGDRVSIRKADDGSSGYRVVFERNSGVNSNAGTYMKRLIKPETGTVENEYFYNGKLSGLSGTEMFAQQVMTLKQQGYKTMNTYAAKGTSIGGIKFNGYYTWLRFGYVPQSFNEQPIIRLTSEGVKRYNKSPKTFSPDGTMTGLMTTAEGKALWKQHAKGGWDGSFDLTDGSYSMNTFKKYYKEKTGKTLK